MKKDKESKMNQNEKESKSKKTKNQYRKQSIQKTQYTKSFMSLQCLLIDNYDSYTYNLYQAVYRSTGLCPLVLYNDCPWSSVSSLLSQVDFIVLSPGPGRPENKQDFGVCEQLLRQEEVPVLGVCLGLQGLGYVYGAKIVHAEKPMHGQLSKVFFKRECVLFEGMEQGFTAVRYNSLVVDRNSVPDSLVITAWSESGEVMGLSRAAKNIAPIESVQFHPESECTQFGYQLICNFVKHCKKRRIDSILPIISMKPMCKVQNELHIFENLAPARSIQLRFLMKTFGLFLFFLWFK